MDFFNKIPTHMDYDGQQRAEYWSRIIITSMGIFGYIFGLYTQLFSYTVITLGVGFLIACLLTLPPWPVYRKKPLKWLNPLPVEVKEKSKEKENSDKTKKKK